MSARLWDSENPMEALSISVALVGLLALVQSIVEKDLSGTILGSVILGLRPTGQPRYRAFSRFSSAFFRPKRSYSTGDR